MALAAEPDLGEVAGRIVDVIEVPYVKPTVRRRRRIGCRMVWARSDMKAELTMRLHPDGGGEVTLAMLDEVTSELTPGASTATAASRTAPDWSVAAGGAIAACGYLAGEVAGGGLSRLAGSLVIALALLVAFVVSTGSARLVIDGRQQVRCGIEMLGAMLFAAGAASAARV